MRIQMELFISVKIFRGKEVISSEQLNCLLPAFTETTGFSAAKIKQTNNRSKVSTLWNTVMQLTTGWHTTVYFHSLVTIRQIWSEPLARTFHVSQTMGTMQKNLVIKFIECWALGSSITHELLSRALTTSAWTLINTVSVLWYCL